MEIEASTVEQPLLRYSAEVDFLTTQHYYHAGIIWLLNGEVARSQTLTLVKLTLDGESDTTEVRTLGFNLLIDAIGTLESDHALSEETPLTLYSTDRYVVNALNGKGYIKVYREQMSVLRDMQHEYPLTSFIYVQELPRVDKLLTIHQ